MSKPSDKVTVPDVLPLIPTRNNRVLLPGIVMRLQIGRKDTTQLMDTLWSRYAKDPNIVIGCVPVKPSPDDPTAKNPSPSSNEGVTAGVKSVVGTGGARQPQSDKPDDPRKPIEASELFQWGVAARVVNFVKNNANEARLTRASYIVTLEGVMRFKINKLTKTSPYFEASIQTFPENEMPDSRDKDLQALIINLRTSGHELASVLSQLQLPATVLNQLRQMLDGTPPGQLADLFASMIDLSMDEKLAVLSTTDLKTRITRTLELLTRQIQVLKISQKLQSTVESKLGKKQREFFLRQQLDAIKKELGEDGDAQEEDEVADLSKRINDAKLPDEPAKAAGRELKRLKRMHPSMAEYQVVRTYLEWLAEVPWSLSTTDVLDISRARWQLDEDHYGLDKVKTRILEFLAVRKLKQDLKGPILCFLGPPGVGKTSLGRSIANAMGRKFHRISLGGVRDEAEIRGHRRTYIGALPGLVVQGLRRGTVNNPVFLLDEIDKLGRDFRGDPSSALLEVLDPEQNSTFSDHYLNVPFDLSNVLFIATANEADTIPGPLLDRMEVIRIPGYTFEEKLFIAKRHLLPKQVKMHGLREEDVKMDDKVLMKIATGYTREAGVRNLEREVASVCRAMAVDYADAKEKGNPDLYNPNVSLEKLEKILGPDRFDDEVAERTAVPGVVTGLAWTASGAGGLLFIEATSVPGKGILQLTGKLGDVIKESAQIGLTWVRGNATKMGITTRNSERSLLENIDVHIHFPAGAIPKDGPSAGVTIVVALVSLFTNKPVREHTAMTGEITLRGQVLPVGGIKEKVLAAHRGGIRRIIMPYRNAKDLVDVPKNVQDEIEFIFAKRVDDVLRAAFADGVKLVGAAPPADGITPVFGTLHAMPKL
ncbi:hypothetical protein SmJEL517_g01597 [Synchytrium microbalum]|uniref:Lon protease homolog 2, peroxisomal n=1 Tax=Synchytrium microbalum TaxID=1806994 RepID=A0A507CDJ4_9FUNG|nr:uncharacterized protein SmJEL517_g01597 [Synchytrium microbalum]TPX36116.1 hypothetical protein SmJEL517_g01597 [Synchytrium microbalum]